MSLQVYDQCPYRARRSDHRPRKPGGQPEGSRLQARERGLRRSQPCGALDLGSKAHRRFSSLNPPPPCLGYLSTQSEETNIPIFSLRCAQSPASPALRYSGARASIPGAPASAPTSCSEMGVLPQSGVLPALTHCGSPQPRANREPHSPCLEEWGSRCPLDGAFGISGHEGPGPGFDLHSGPNHGSCYFIVSHRPGPLEGSGRSVNGVTEQEASFPPTVPTKHLLSESQSAY